MPRRAATAETAAVARRAKVAALYLRGKSQVEIAKAVRASQPTVSRDLAALRAEWRSAAARDLGERVAEELARVDRLEAEAWEAWDRSRKAAEVTTTEKAGTRGGKGATPAVRSKASTRIIHRDGEPRFLHVVEWCISRRCELLGLDAPAKLNTRTVLAGDPNAPLKHDHTHD
ncbi:MAG TPA: hypothetical protein VD866_09285, partial [Urbifossiella sp.]|nr:hypothetical protein [Urbifossiella sp.]